MISVTALRARLLPVFRLLGSRGITMDVYYKGDVYKLTITPTGNKAPKPYYARPSARKKPVNPRAFKFRHCKECGDVMVNNICLNKRCTIPAIQK